MAWLPRLTSGIKFLIVSIGSPLNGEVKPNASCYLMPYGLDVLPSQSSMALMLL